MPGTAQEVPFVTPSAEIGMSGEMTKVIAQGCVIERDTEPGGGNMMAA
jgi:hypothetical protein